MRNSPRIHYLQLSVLFYRLILAPRVWAEQVVVDGLTITSPPFGRVTDFARLQRRDNNTCSFGSCAGTCLDQGAFCCNPGGTSFLPNWICDNGACITSVRGDTGVVDCYDPDNPSGTTQSCIDFKPTTTCFSTDRCYTCESDVPFCHWQTWIADGSPTLRWFSCITDEEPDSTYLAATITAAPSSNSSEVSSLSSTLAISATSASATSVSSTPTTSPISTSSSPAPTSSPVLSTGAIAGIAAGGGILLLIIIGLLIYCIRVQKSAAALQNQQTNRPIISHPSPAVELATPVYYSNSLTGSGSQGTAADDLYWRNHSHPNLAAGEERYKMRLPVELPVHPPAEEIGIAE